MQKELSKTGARARIASMKRHQAYAFALEPNGAQQKALAKTMGCARFVYNKALALQKENFANGVKHTPFNKLCPLLVTWKKSPEMKWLAEVNAAVLQQSLMDLDWAFKRFFNKTSAYPSMKKKGRESGLRYPQNFKIDEKLERMYVPSVGWMRYRKSREIEGTPKNMIVSLRAGRWQVSIQTEREVPTPMPTAVSAVGIDMGVARFATLSDGTALAPVSAFRRQQKRLAKAQRVVSRKKKFSKNWAKANARVQSIHSEIANVRRDFLQKASTAISKNHALVVIEDLKIANMVKSAKGTKAKPGKGVKAKSALNKAIMDQGWGLFRKQLDYKLLWSGGLLVAVAAHNTSRRCSACGHVSAENRKTQAKFQCVKCGFKGHADHNAAVNILAAGHAVLARESSSPEVGASLREPIETTPRKKSTL